MRRDQLEKALPGLPDNFGVFWMEGGNLEAMSATAKAAGGSMTYSHCTDGEFFRGEFATAEDAAADAFHDNPDLDSVEVGENHKSPASFYVSADSIIEDIAQRASDECPGNCRRLARKPDVRQGKDGRARKACRDWLEANEPPTFWRVDNTRTITRAEMVAGGHMGAEA